MSGNDALPAGPSEGGNGPSRGIPLPPSRETTGDEDPAMTYDEQFIREAENDPYTAAIARMYADAWADGYEAARREVEALASDERGVISPESPLFPACAALRSESGSELRTRAFRFLADRKNVAERQFVTALAALGRKFPDVMRGPHDGS